MREVYFCSASEIPLKYALLLSKQAMDANQRWNVDEAISYMKSLAKFKPIWIEEPTSPDDVLGKPVGNFSSVFFGIFVFGLIDN